jgi:hypothetical protein
MPRLLNDKPCEVVFQDRISNSEITLYYRLPTTEERIAYANAQIIRKGNTIKNNMGEARSKYGLLILTGFKDGDFEKEEGRPLASDPKSPHYDPAWKSYLRQFASDIVSLLAIHVFEASVVPVTEDMMEGDKEEGVKADNENPS